MNTCARRRNSNDGTESPFRNGEEMLQAFRDLFDSGEEMEEFGDFLEQMREEDRARYRD